jgi:hypothetical protein
VLGIAALAQGAKPPVPSGLDPGGVAIALISTGIDYTLPQVARRLARDGEGEPIAWDLEDKDRKPFEKSKGGTRPEWGGDGTLVATLLLGTPTLRLVPVRVDTSDPVSLARAIAFVAQTPARVAVVPMWGTTRADWEPFRQAAVRFKDVLLVVPAGTGAEPVYPAALSLDNILAVTQGTASADAAGFGGALSRVSGAVLAVAAAGMAAADLLAREPGLDAAALKRRLGEAGGGLMWQAQR